MTFAALHKRVTYLFAGLGFAALALGGELPPLALAALLLGAAASWRFEGPRLHTRAHVRLLTAVALGGFALQVVRGILGAEPLGLGLEYAGLLQLTRLFHRRTSTEHLHVVGLGFLHLLAGTLLSTGLDYALVFLGFVIVTPWMLSLTHLRAELERRHATPAELEGPPPERLARLLDSPSLASRGFLLASSLLSLPLFAITASFFLLFPRVGLGALTFGGARGDAVAGFGDSVDLGRFGTIRDDPTVALRIFVPEGAPRPASSSFRMRGTSFERYDGRRWTRRPGPAMVHEPRLGAVSLAPVPPRSQQRELRIVAEPLEGGVVFLPEGSYALTMAPRVEDGALRPRRIRERRGLDLRLSEPSALAFEYVAHLDARAPPVPEHLDDDYRAELLRVPPGLERLAALAAELTRDAQGDRDAAERIERHLRDSGLYRYDTTSAPHADDPLLHFLFRARRGHCELFASAMAMLLRARGIPARNVTGFLGGRWNSFGGYYAIQQGDAHSWVEAYVDDAFVRFDPTPPSRAATMPEPGPLGPLRAWLDALRARWTRDVVGYDLQRQVELALSVRELVRGPRGAHRASEASEPSTASRRWLLIPLGALAVWALLRLRRRPTRPRPDELEALYRRLDALLARDGHPRPAARTPSEHLAALQALGHPAADEIAAFTEAYSRLRYRGDTADRAALARMREALRRIARIGSRRPLTSR